MSGKTGDGSSVEGLKAGHGCEAGSQRRSCAPEREGNNHRRVFTVFTGTHIGELGDGFLRTDLNQFPLQSIHSLTHDRFTRSNHRSIHPFTGSSSLHIVLRRQTHSSSPSSHHHVSNLLSHREHILNVSARAKSSSFISLMGIELVSQAIPTLSRLPLRSTFSSHCQ